MKEERYFYVPGASENGELPQDEAVHALRVLRLKEGDSIFLMDGEGTFYKAEVTLATNKHCAYRVLETMPQQRSWRGHLHIATAPTKMMERMEWMAEKATEIGVDEFSFLECQFSERRQMRADRIEKIVVAATKQSRKAWKPIVNDMQSFRSFIEQPREGLKFICHCYDEIERKDLFETLKSLESLGSLKTTKVPVPVPIPVPALAPSVGCDSVGCGSVGCDSVATTSTVPALAPSVGCDSVGCDSVGCDSVATTSIVPITVLIGPEGDFSIEEVRLAMEHGFQSVSLGSQRLRTETAALSAVMIMQLSNKL